MKNILKRAVARKAEKKPQEKPAERGYVEPCPCGCAPRTCASMLYVIACAIILCGCVYKGAKVTEGTDLAIGLNVPVSEGTLQLQVLNYLSGFRLGVDRNAILRCKYTVSETNSYLGVVRTCVCKSVDATVEPCGNDSDPEVEAENTAE